MLSFLYSLSLINSYITFNAKKLGLAKRSKEDPINSTSTSSANNL